MDEKTDLRRRYDAIIIHVFFKNWREGRDRFEFARGELAAAANELGITGVKNLGDITYTFRYRHQLPKAILETQPEGREWIIDGGGRGVYVFRLVRESRILPRADQAVIEIPDATPEIIRLHALNDEQALLAIVRYNRLIDVFLGLRLIACRTTYARP